MLFDELELIELPLLDELEAKELLLLDEVELEELPLLGELELEELVLPVEVELETLLLLNELVLNGGAESPPEPPLHALRSIIREQMTIHLTVIIMGFIPISPITPNCNHSNHPYYYI